MATLKNLWQLLPNSPSAGHIVMEAWGRLGPVAAVINHEGKGKAFTLNVLHMDGVTHHCLRIYCKFSNSAQKSSLQAASTVVDVLCLSPVSQMLFSVTH